MNDQETFQHFNSKRVDVAYSMGENDLQCKVFIPNGGKTLHVYITEVTIASYIHTQRKHVT